MKSSRSGFQLTDSTDSSVLYLHSVILHFSQLAQPTSMDGRLDFGHLNTLDIMFYISTGNISHVLGLVWRRGEIVLFCFFFSQCRLRHQRPSGGVLSSRETPTRFRGIDVTTAYMHKVVSCKWVLTFPVSSVVLDSFILLRPSLFIYVCCLGHLFIWSI